MESMPSEGIQEILSLVAGRLQGLWTFRCKKVMFSELEAIC